VSIVEMPSIMMLVAPPPPSRLVPLTPGASDASAEKPRLAIGRFCTDSVVTVKDRSPVLAWITDDSPLTSMTSLMPPTSMVKSPSAARDPGLTVTPDRLRVLNDGIST
jgi:hypothetical protein